MDPLLSSPRCSSARRVEPGVKEGCRTDRRPLVSLPLALSAALRCFADLIHPISLSLHSLLSPLYQPATRCRASLLAVALALPLPFPLSPPPTFSLQSSAVRKSIARVLTVINKKQRDNLREFYKDAKYLPLDLRYKKTRAIRRRLTKGEKAKVTEKQHKKNIHFPLRSESFSLVSAPWLGLWGAAVLTKSSLGCASAEFAVKA